MEDNKQNQNKGSGKPNDTSIPNLENNPKEIAIDILTKNAKDAKIWLCWSWWYQQELRFFW